MRCWIFFLLHWQQKFVVQRNNTACVTLLEWKSEIKKKKMYLAVGLILLNCTCQQHVHHHPNRLINCFCFLQLLSMATFLGAIFCFVAFCSKNMYGFLVLFAIGELLVFATQVIFFINRHFSLWLLSILPCSWNQCILKWFIVKENSVNYLGWH